MLAAILAEVRSSDLDLLFVLLALFAFGAAIYLAVQNNIVGAAVAVFVAVAILLVT